MLMKFLAGLFVTAFLLCSTGGQSAFAHATLVSSTPNDGDLLLQPPAAVSLRFNEPVSILSATLVDASGQLVPLDDAVADGGIVTIPLPPLSKGSYAVSWRAVSDDGHPIAAATSFVVGKNSGSVLPASPVRDKGIEVGLWTARLLLFISLVFGVGGATFRTLAGKLPHEALTVSKICIVGGIVAAVTVVGLQGLDLLGLRLAELTSAAPWQAGFKSPFGTTAVLSATALAFSFAALAARSVGFGTAAATISMLFLGLSFCFSGHASVAEPRWLSKTALFIHAVAISWWIGALLPLSLLLRLERRLAAPPLIRFSRFIPYAVIPLLASGFTLAALQLGPPGPSWLSAYGLIFAAKFVLLWLLFAIASWNRWVLTPPAAAGNARALRSMRKGIAYEIILSLMILALVAGWRFTPPPRALAAQTSQLATVLLQDNQLNVHVSLDPARVGSNTIGVDVNRSNESLQPKSVRIALHPPTSTLAPLIRDAQLDEENGWVVPQVLLPVAGVWTVQVEVRISDFDLVKLSGPIDVKAP